MFNHPYETELFKKKESDFLPLYALPGDDPTSMGHVI